ncbi:hypothetical protein DFS34DRAFT_624320 [Phlyctochytrium arcticum]|nr:hypothetical protein DFS34DRAFT_624320 [Phlyctochytrium arcticum]
MNQILTIHKFGKIANHLVKANQNLLTWHPEARPALSPMSQSPAPGDGSPSTTPAAPEFAVTAERLLNLKSRLQAISVKHASRRSSVDSVNSQKLSVAESADMGEDGGSAAGSVTGGGGGQDSPRVLSISTHGSSNHVDSPMPLSETESLKPVDPLVVTAEQAAKEPSPTEDCACRKVLDSDNLRHCKECKGFLHPIAKLENERSALQEELVKLRSRLGGMEQRQDASAREMAVLRGKVQDAEEALAQKELEVISVKKDLDSMGQKLIDEVEMRAELQHSKDAIQEELEELTKSLFEEANSMVASEARQRHEYQKKEELLRLQVIEMQQQLGMERDQLRELRGRMEDMDHDPSQVMSTSGSWNQMATGGQRTSVYSTQSDVGDDGQSPEDAIDPVLFAEFEDFISGSADVKLHKMHTLSFMKNALEDDVTACLRFGGNPRTSTKKLIDAIASNTCFVEEMTSAQIAALDARMVRMMETNPVASPRRSISPHRENKRNSALLADSSDAPVQTRTPPPTQTVFNKTVMERLSSAFSGGTFQMGSTNTTTLVAAGCSTCGRNQPIAISPSLSNSFPVLNTTRRAGPTTSSANALDRNEPPSPSSPSIAVSPSPMTPCRFHFRTSDLPDDAWAPICANCRDRLVAVCEFYQFARHVRQGLYSARRHEEVYLEMLSYKRKMFYARVGAAKFAEREKVFSKKKTRPNSVLGGTVDSTDNDDASNAPTGNNGSAGGGSSTMPNLSFSPLSKRRSGAIAANVVGSDASITKSNTSGLSEDLRPSKTPPPKDVTLGA